MADTITPSLPITTPSNFDSTTLVAPSVAQPQTTPAAPITPITTTPVMPTPVKTALETAANSETTALGSGVPTNSPVLPSADYTLQPGESITAYNARIASEEAAASGTTTSGTSGTGGSTSTPTPVSTSSAPNINDYLGAVPAQPAAPNYVADQSTEEANVGIPALQTNIANLNTQLSNLQAQAITNESNVANKPGVVESVINGQVKFVDAQTAFALKQIQGQITDANAQLKQAQTVVTTYMANDKADYTAAEAQYEDDYKNAVTQYNADAASYTKGQTTARANSTLIINSFKGTDTSSTGGITDTNINDWDNLDIQAGLPVGTTLAAVVNQLNVTKFQKGDDGNEYIVGMNNGVPYVAEIGSAGGTTAAANAGLPTTAQKNAAAGIPAAGALTKAQYTKLEGAGVTQGQADSIVTSLLQGDSLQTIRQNITAAGGNPAILDEFNNAVGIDTITKTT